LPRGIDGAFVVLGDAQTTSLTLARGCLRAQRQLERHQACARQYRERLERVVKTRRRRPTRRRDGATDARVRA
jgi:hypothetical protein